MKILIFIWITVGLLITSASAQAGWFSNMCNRLFARDVGAQLAPEPAPEPFTRAIPETHLEVSSEARSQAVPEAPAQMAAELHPSLAPPVVVEAVPALHPFDLAKSQFNVAKHAGDWVTNNNCISCHTVLPYAFANLGAQDPHAIVANQAIRGYIAGRAENFMAAPVWYPEVASNSRDSEAVISALMIASEEQGRPTSALGKKVFQNLTSLQKADGSWDWLDEDLEPFETKRAKLFGNVMASLAYSRAGADVLADAATSASVTKLKGFLRTEATRTDLNRFDKASLLWADSAYPDLLSEAQKKAFAKEIMAAQEGSGGFSMNKMGNWQKQNPNLAHGPDGLATAFVLASVQKNVALQADPEIAQAWRRGRDWLKANQNADGRFPASSVNSNKEFNHGIMTDFATSLSAGILAAP